MVTPFPPLTPATNVDEVVVRIESIIAWSLQNDEIELIDAGLVGFRDSAWDFATVLSLEPLFLDPATITLRDLETAAFGALVMKPPQLIGALVNAIAARESRDVVHNIQVLDGIASEPLVVDENRRVRSSRRSQPARPTRG
jgi:hypothetical protein